MSSSDLLQRVARVEAGEAIRNLVGRYAEAADLRNDPEIMATLFTEDAQWQCEGFGCFRGRDEIVRELARVAREQVLWSLHVMAQPSIELAPEGDRACARWVLWELASMGNAQGEARDHWLGGRYVSEAQLTQQGWRFSCVTLRIDLLSPYAEGFSRSG